MKDSKIKKLGSIVKKTRKKQRLTQQQLALASGVGVRFIRELEQGKNSCHIGKALIVVSMLGIDTKVDGEQL